MRHRSIPLPIPNSPSGRAAARARTARIAPIALLALAAILCGSASAQVYKWVDAQGVTHYSEAPPPGKDGKAQVLNLPQTPPGASESGGAASENWQAKEQQFRERQAKAADARKKEEDREQQEAAARHQACLRARQQLDLLNRQTRIYKVNENGDRVYLSDDDRARQTALANQQVADNCGS